MGERGMIGFPGRTGMASFISLITELRPIRVSYWLRGVDQQSTRIVMLLERSRITEQRSVWSLIGDFGDSGIANCQVIECAMFVNNAQEHQHPLQLASE